MREGPASAPNTCYASVPPRDFQGHESDEANDLWTHETVRQAHPLHRREELKVLLSESHRNPITYKMSDEKFFIVYNAANRDKDFNWLKKNSKGFEVEKEQFFRKNLIFSGVYRNL